MQPLFLYTSLANWWPLLSPPEHYVEEAADLLPRLGDIPPDSTLLELGSGGGSLAFHLKGNFRMTLTDLSPAMLEQNRLVNPEAELLQGDMRTLRLGREFDFVLLHDAVMYMTRFDDLRAALTTVALHCKPGGTVAVMPDHVREAFEASTEHGGEDGDGGRGFRYLAWTWDPDPADSTYVVDYAFLLRESSGAVSVVHERHVEGLFHTQEWLELFAEVGIDAHADIDPYNRTIFIGKRTGATPPRQTPGSP